MKYLLLLPLLFLMSCDLSMPDVREMNPNCRAALHCMYLNQRNPDKTVCSDLVAGCKALNDFSVCVEQKEMPLNNCLLLLKK